MNQPLQREDYRNRTPHAAGFATLELMIVFCLLVSTWFIVRSLPQSRSLIKVEAHAVGTIAQIIAAEASFHEQNEGGTSRYAGLGELIGRADDVGLRLPAGSRYDHRFHALVIGGYCYAVYLSDPEQSGCHSYREGVRTDFYVIYAWPLHHGNNGRRVFVATNRAGIRFWENSNGLFEGLEAKPPARLAKPNEGQTWPLKDDRPNWFDGIIWNAVP